MIEEIPENKYSLKKIEIKYSIHFLWLNRSTEESRKTQKYICPLEYFDFGGNNRMLNIENFLKISEWIRINPEAQVKIWHDATTNMTNNTMNLIKFLYSYGNKNKLYLIYKLIEIKKKIDFIIMDDDLIFDDDDVDASKTKTKTEINILLEDIFLGHAILNYIDINGVYTENFYNLVEKVSSEINLIVNPENFFDNNFENIPIFFESIITLNKLKLCKKNTPLLWFFGLDEHNNIIKKSINVYFKADLVRLIILLQEVYNNKDTYAVYADIDCIPLSKNQIFLPQCFDLLNIYGLVMPPRSKGKSGGEFENYFHIMAGENLTNQYKCMFFAINKILIDLNIERLYRKNPKISGESVYNLYQDMFIYYFSFKYNINLTLKFRTPLDQSLYQSLEISRNIFEFNFENYVKEYLNNINHDEKKSEHIFVNNIKNRIIYPTIDDFYDICPQKGNYNK
jgi:hypothetical protein